MIKSQRNLANQSDTAKLPRPKPARMKPKCQHNSPVPNSEATAVRTAPAFEKAPAYFISYSPFRNCALSPSCVKSNSVGKNKFASMHERAAICPCSS